MSLFFVFFCFFSSLSLVSATLVIVSKNPIYSVLFLILSFCNVSVLLFLLSFEFLPITFLVVYVGAIAVLFLFVLMMLNIKQTELNVGGSNFLPVVCLLAFVFSMELFVMVRLEFLPLAFSFNHKLFFSDFVNTSLSNVSNSPLAYIHENNMRSIGVLLFIEYRLHFVLVGYILLFAMIGVITLTLHKKFISKSQNTYFQVLRNFNDCVTYYGSNS